MFNRKVSGFYFATAHTLDRSLTFEEMIIPIRIESIENDIAECSKHLDFLKKLSVLGKEFTEFVSKYKLNGNDLIDADITNIHCVITITQLEISLILKSLYNTKHELEEKHILKNGILIIYEAIKSIDKFNKALKNHSNLNDEMKTEFKKYSDEIKMFKKNIDLNRKIKNIRNNIAGHINVDFVAYSKFIESIEIEKTMNCLISFRFIINRLNDYLFKCMMSKKSK